MKKRLLTLIAAAMLAISGSAQAQPPANANMPTPAKTIELYKGEIPGAIGTAPDPTDGNNFWITSVSRPSLAYYPANENSGTAIIVCPGGGYAGLTYMFEGTMTAQWLSSKGISAFVLKYRLPDDKYMKDRKNGPLQVVQQAIR